MTKTEALLNKFTGCSIAELDALNLNKRIDSKFIANKEVVQDILSTIQGYRVLDVHNKRIFSYKNFYLDYPDYQFYLHHHNKKANRKKIRIREYVENKQLFYEIKHKNNKGFTDKKRIKTDYLLINNLQENLHLFNNIHPENSNLKHSISNNYNRFNLINFDSQEKITIDSNINFEKNGHKATLNHLVIIEVKQKKYNPNTPLINLLSKYNIRKTPFSKYCIGLSILDENIKKNNFKPILSKIQDSISKI